VKFVIHRSDKKPTAMFKTSPDVMWKIKQETNHYWAIRYYMGYVARGSYDTGAKRLDKLIKKIWKIEYLIRGKIEKNIASWKLQPK
jgi:hypothetical protein